METKNIEELYKAIKDCESFEDRSNGLFELFNLINKSKIEMGIFNPPLNDLANAWINWQFQETKIVILTVLDFIKSNANPKE